MALSFGCEARPPAAPTDRPDVGASPVTHQIDFEPMAERLALPTQVRALRLPAGSVGTYVDRELPDGVPLRAVGLNLCQTGWMIQGFIERDGELRATPPLPIRYATLPIGPAEAHHPDVADQKLALDFSTATMTRLDGSLRVIAAVDGSEVMKMTIDDAAPVGIATGPGLGAQGCFTTGYYQLRLGNAERVGPVSAVWDQKRLHYVGLRLTEKHGVGVWLHLEPAHRQPQNVIRGDLATVRDKPTRFPFRVVFETRTTTPQGVVVEETPATEGTLTAVFARANPQGPVRIELRDLVVPAWDGPLAGATLDLLRTEALLVTDLEGVGVPVPSKPLFDQETAQRPDSPDAAPHVPPASSNQK